MGGIIENTGVLAGRVGGEQTTAVLTTEESMFDV
jgi:hypothetical protein